MGKVYVRVDDCLIHGQTIVAWCPTLGIQEIIAIVDVSAQNPMLKSILTMGVPKNYKTNIVTTAEANELLKKESDKNRLIIVKFPEKLAEISENIKGCEQLILGNIAKRADTIHKVSGATGIFYLSDSFVVGVILGNVPTAMMVGIPLQIMYMGNVTLGGAVAWDLSYATYIGTAGALVFGKGMGTAEIIGLATVFAGIGGLVGQLIGFACRFIPAVIVLSSMTAALAAAFFFVKKFSIFSGAYKK